MDIRVAIVMTVFNRVEKTLKCLSYIEDQTYKNFDIFICDDGSTDNSSAIIKEVYPNVKIVKGDGTLWWAGGTNLAIQEAIKTNNYNYILTLNNDIRISNNYLETLVHSAEKNPASIIGSLSLSDEEIPKILFGGFGEINWKKASIEKKFSDMEVYNCNKYTGLWKTTMLIGRGTLIPLDVIKKVGLFDSKKFPQHMADIEFSLRASKAGYRLLQNNEAIVFTVRDSENKKGIYGFIVDLFSIRSPRYYKPKLYFVIKHCPKRFLMPYLLSTLMKKII